MGSCLRPLEDPIVATRMDLHVAPPIVEEEEAIENPTALGGEVPGEATPAKPARHEMGEPFESHRVAAVEAYQPAHLLGVEMDVQLGVPSGVRGFRHDDLLTTRCSEPPSTF